MSTIARASLLTLAALLSACASPPPPAPVAKPVVFSTVPEEISPIAADVLFRAFSLVGRRRRAGAGTEQRC